MEESRKKANKKWLTKNYESITIRVPKGTREQIKAWEVFHARPPSALKQGYLSSGR